jgi:hypothetical protein
MASHLNNVNGVSAAASTEARTSGREEKNVFDCIWWYLDPIKTRNVACEPSMAQDLVLPNQTPSVQLSLHAQLYRCGTFGADETRKMVWNPWKCGGQLLNQGLLK